MAGILGVLAIAILFRSIYFIAARSFYAQQDTRTPLYISIFAVGLNVVLAVWFTRSLNMGAYGLALAQSIMAFVEVVILFFVMNSRIKGIFDPAFWHAVGRMVSATGITAVVSYIMVTLLPLQAGDNSSIYFAFPKFVVIVGVSFSVYIGLSKLFKLYEAEPLLRTARTLIRRLTRRTA